MEKRIRSRPISKHFPEEIVEGILVQLPVKSLLRFKCVSKPWRCLISSRGFAREHLNNSNNNTATDFAHHHLMFQFHPSSNRVSTLGTDYLPVARFTNARSMGSCRIGPLLSDDDYQPNSNCLLYNQSIPTPTFEDKQETYLWGSCGGLVLISTENYELYLWNPTTRKAKNITNASFPEGTAIYGWNGCGFGYDELTDDYKVVCNFYGAPGQWLMYSSRADSWKKIRNFEQGSLLEWQVPFVNGRLHWLNKEGEERHAFDDVTIRWNIVSLDLVDEDEKYQIIAPPPYCGYSNNNNNHRQPVLGELGGYLCFISYKRINRNQNTMDVWVMKKESWSKIWTFSDQAASILPRPIWLKKNGDIVVTSGSDVVVYRGEDKLSQSLVDKISSQSRSIVYVESLVEPISL